MDFCVTVDVLFGPVIMSPTVRASHLGFGLYVTVNCELLMLNVFAMINTCVQYVLNIRALLGLNLIRIISVIGPN